MKKVTKQLAVIFAVIAVMLAVATSPAAAAWSDCPAGKFCTYTNYYGGNPMYYYSPQPAGTCTNIGYPWNDNIRSVRNLSGHTIRLHMDAGCNNGWCCIDTWAKGDGGNVGYYMVDQASSIQWY